MTLQELRKITLKKPVSDKVMQKYVDSGYVPDLRWLDAGDDYYGILEKWKLTFVGAYASKYLPLRCNVLDALCKGLGRMPECKDFTRLGIERIFNMLRQGSRRDVCNNTLHQYGKEFKAVLNELKYDIELPYNGFNKSLTLKKEDSQFVYLTEEEIERLDKYEPKSRVELYTKKLFMISCWTGCRHSDAERLTLNHINGGTLSFVTKKTKTSVSMRAKPALMKYLSLNTKKYRGKTLQILKDMCRQVGIDEMVTIYQGGKEMTKPKYCFVSPHTARRSFATNLHMRGADINTIRYLMGHSDISITQGYICDVRDLDYNANKFFD